MANYSPLARGFNTNFIGSFIQGRQQREKEQAVKQASQLRGLRAAVLQQTQQKNAMELAHQSRVNQARKLLAQGNVKAASKLAPTLVSHFQDQQLELAHNGLVASNQAYSTVHDLASFNKANETLQSWGIEPPIKSYDPQDFTKQKAQLDIALNGFQSRFGRQIHDIQLAKHAGNTEFVDAFTKANKKYKGELVTEAGTGNLMRVNGTTAEYVTKGGKIVQKATTTRTKQVEPPTPDQRKQAFHVVAATIPDINLDVDGNGNYEDPVSAAVVQWVASQANKETRANPKLDYDTALRRAAGKAEAYYRPMVDILGPNNIPASFLPPNTPVPIGDKVYNSSDIISTSEQTGLSVDEVIKQLKERAESNGS